MSGVTSTGGSIYWRQVWSLIALEAAVIISWVAYHNYQIGLLREFNLGALTLQILIAKAVILLVTPPVAGRLADHFRHKGRDRLPLVKLGVNLVAMIFMATAFTIFSGPSSILQWVLPLLIVLWLVLMNVFYSPAISTVELFVPREQLPVVLAIFAVVADLVQAIEPSLEALINSIGAPGTFALGGILVFATGWYFRKTTRELTDQQEEETNRRQQEGVQSQSFVKVFGYGLAFGLATALFFEYFPELAAQRVAGWGWDGGFFTTILIAVAALLAWPLSRLVTRTNISRIAAGSFALCLVIGVLLFWGPAAEWVNIAFFCYPPAFALASVTLLPLAFTHLQPAHKIIGVGLFFSGLELPNSLAEIAKYLATAS